MRYAPDAVPPRRFTLTTAAIVAAAMAGLFAAVGLFTLDYAKGLSYLSTDPSACANCHIMQPQFDSWERASHRNVAGCVDCHLPASGIDKWIEKAKQGYRHSAAFTLQNFREPIQITEGSRDILQRNCVGCHRELTAELEVAHADGVRCVHCHRRAGHGDYVGLGGPDTSSFESREQSDE